MESLLPPEPSAVLGVVKNGEGPKDTKSIRPQTSPRQRQARHLKIARREARFVQEGQQVYELLSDDKTRAIRVR